MDGEQLLQHLRDLSLEEGRVYIQEHIAELSDHDAVASVLADEALRLMYTPFVSLKLAELLISYGDYTGHLSAHALGLKAKGDALMAIGHYQAAMDVLDAARDEFRSLDDEGNAARTRISWVVSAAWTGRVEEALQEAARARTVFQELGESYWVGVIDSNTALIYADVGRYQDAARLYEDMLTIYARASDQNENVVRRSTAIAQANYAQSLTLIGDFVHAYDLLEQAQANFFVLGEVALAVSVEHDLADLDYAQSYYGSALRRYYQAHDTLVQHGMDSPVLLAEIKLSMTNCLIKLNRAEEACLVSQEAVESLRQLGLSFKTGKALREYAAAQLASRRLREALSALEEAQSLFTNGGFQPYAFDIRLQQAQILLEMDSADEAYGTVQQVKQYCDAQSLVVRAVHAMLIMAEALLNKAQDAAVRGEQEQQALLLEEAMALCKEAAARARERNLQEEMYRIYYLLGRISSLKGNLAGAARHYRAAIAQTERIMDDLVYDLSPSFLHTAWAVYEDMIVLCLSQAHFRQAFSYLEQARSMALRQYLSKAATSRANREEQPDASVLSPLQANSAMILRTEQELNDYQDRYHYFSMLLAQLDTTVSPDIDREVIQAELKRDEGKIGELFERLYLYQSGIGLKSAEISRKKRSRTQSKRIDVVQLQRELAPGQVLLEYFSYQGKLVVFVVTAQNLVTRELPANMEQLERLLLLLHAHLDPRTWPDPHNPPQLAVRRLLNRLYDALVKPVAELLPPSGQITIVPYGSLLHTLPFHALYDGSHFLIERFQVNYLPTSTLLVHLEKLRHERATQAVQPELPARPPLVLGYSENEHLQRVREEAQMVASLLRGCCYLDSEATIARLIEQAPGSPVIHIATHGQSRLDAPNFSYMRLADGQLNAIDAFSLDLRACELVTLSGCETGLALSGGGDEQLGLGRAFLAAGTVALVMSLWPVEDNATNELMQLFYEELLKGESKGEALRSAQRSLLQRSGSAHAHPYFWAAFRLVGEVGPLLYQKTEHNSTL